MLLPSVLNTSLAKHNRNSADSATATDVSANRTARVHVSLRHNNFVDLFRSSTINCGCTLISCHSGTSGLLIDGVCCCSVCWNNQQLLARSDPQTFRSV